MYFLKMMHSQKKTRDLVNLRLLQKRNLESRKESKAKYLSSSEKPENEKKRWRGRQVDSRSSIWLNQRVLHENHYMT